MSMFKTGLTHSSKSQWLASQLIHFLNYCRLKNHIKIFDIYRCQSCNFDEHCLHLHVLCMQIMNITIKEQLASLQWNFRFLVEDIVFMNSLPAGFTTCEIQLYANVTSHFLLTKQADKLKS